MENPMAVQVQEEMQQVAVRLRRDVYDRLDRYRNKTRISKTATIEQAIIEHLDRMEKTDG
jgi:predicted transcriptional regulator